MATQVKCTGSDLTRTSSAAACGNDALGRNVVWIGGDFDVWQTNGSDLGEHQAETALCIAQPLLPRDDRIANVTETVRGKFGSARLPPKPDASAKLAVPQPALETRKTLDN